MITSLKILYVIGAMWLGYLVMNNKKVKIMNNIKTTLGGIIAGLSLAINPLLEAYKAGAFDGKTGGQLVASIAIVLIGIYAQDAKKDK